VLENHRAVRNIRRDIKEAIEKLRRKKMSEENAAVGGRTRKVDALRNKKMRPLALKEKILEVR